MNKEVISNKQGIALVILFIIGSNSIMATGLAAKQDIWLAVILAMIISIPLVLLYARLHYLFPNKDLFSIIELCFGKILGKVLLIFVVFFVFETTASIAVLYGQFVVTVSLTETQQTVIVIGFMILCMWITKYGIEVMCRWSVLFAVLVLASFFILTITAIPYMNFNNFRPMLSNGIKPILEGANDAFFWPFSQIIAIMMICSNFVSRKSPHKIYTYGLLIGGTTILIISIAVTSILGVEKASSLYFPSYSAAARLNIGNVLQRIEIIPGVIYTLGVFMKVSIFLMATSKGVAKVFNFSDYRFLVVPITLLVINLTYFEFDSLMHYFSWSDIWYVYVLPFQLILPIVLWIVAEIRKKKIVNN